MVLNPFDEITNKLETKIPANLNTYLPNKWEKNGDILIIALPKLLKNHKKIIGEVYAHVLECKSVLNDIGGISGELREPNTEVIFGSNNTVTIHKENGVRFKLNPQKIMFSSGNMNERIRMANISKPGEVVVDLFAGIGYFTLPIAVHSKPKKIYACEKNPISYDFLCENVSLNNVNSIVEPLSGDNREVAPIDIADRVIMGYFGTTISFLPAAFRCLRNNYGIIHFHDKFPDEDVPNITMDHINNEARKFRLNVNLLRYIKVKSFAPGISHYVFDLEIGKNE
ncbi:MAG: class I SAM-dependent methyltransferase family protein [Candidatus Thermoplasmatota archaeon]|nr:class I SAM-dependent methyltransferase family protein [Candidatus Thermoplasmatota archaeon]